MSKSLTTEPSTVPRRMPALLVMLGLTQFLLGTSLGCRTTSDNQIDLLERELRVQEDYIYELEDYVVEYSDKLRSCRSCSPPQTAVYSEQVYEPELEAAPKYNKRSRKTTRHKRSQENSVVEPVEEPDVEPDVEPVVETQEDELPTPEDIEPAPEVSPEDLDVPDSLDFDLDEPVSDLDETRPLQQVAAIELDYETSTESVLFIPDPVDFNRTAARAKEFSEEMPDEQLVEDLFADEQVDQTVALVERVAERLDVAQLFRGEGDVLSPGNGLSQTLLTVIEALDANGEPVDLDGKISLMVMLPEDSTENAPLMRLKRWDFTAEETVAAWQSTDLGDGLHLELPLEKLKLPKTPLELWVRLVTSDGRKLIAQLPFEASQLSDVADVPPQPLPTGLTRTEPESETTVASVNSLRIETKRIPEREKLKRAESQPPADQPHWRASMQRTDRTAEGFATTSSKAAGWTTQAPGRQPYAPARVASALISSRPSPVQTKAPAKKPVWTSGRTVLPR